VWSGLWSFRRVNGSSLYSIGLLSALGKWQQFDPPCKIETLEQIGAQFVMIDYVDEMNVYSKFGEIRSLALWVDKRVKYNFIVTLYIFSISLRRKR